MHILFKVKNHELLEIQLIKGKLTINKTHLTISQDFDIMLITTLDRILSRNKIERLSLKSVEIAGKMPFNAVSGMVIQAVAKALNSRNRS